MPGTLQAETPQAMHQDIGEGEGEYIVSVEEAPLLVAVQGIIGCIQVESDLPWRRLMGLQEQIHQQAVQGLGASRNLLVAIPGR